jgi:predicted CopG family antitoxin
MHSIYDSLRTKYDAAKSGNYFNDQKNIDNIWDTSLEPRCNEDTPILNTFGIQVSTKETVATGTAAAATADPWEQLKKMTEIYDDEDSFEDFVNELVEEKHHIQIDIGGLSDTKWKRIHRILRKAKIKDLPDKDEFLKSLVKKVGELVEEDTEVTSEPELGAVAESKKK